MQSEVTIFRKLFLWLWDFGGNPSKWNDKVSEIYGRVSAQCPAISNERQLESLLPSDVSVRADTKNYFLFLEPVSKSFNAVPVLSLKCDFGRNIPEVRLRVALYFIDKDDQLQAVGIRYESPEGTGGHHYYHAQFITGFHTCGSFADARSGEENFSLQDFWSRKAIPTKQPAFPLDADGPVKLLLCLLISLYGLSFLGKLRNESDLGSELDKHYFPGMKFVQFDPIVWYWKVSPRDPSKKGYTIYDTQKTPEEFRKIMQKHHPGHNIAGITKKEYEREPKRKRKRC